MVTDTSDVICSELGHFELLRTWEHLYPSITRIIGVFGVNKSLDVRFSCNKGLMVCLEALVSVAYINSL